MGKFRSLMYREWILLKKGMLISCMVVLGFLALILAFIFSIDANSQDVNWLSSSIYSGMMLCMFAPFGMDTVIKRDMDAGWLCYSYVLPISPLERAAVRLADRGLMCISGCVYSLILSAVLCAVAEEPIRVEYIVPMVLILDIMLAMKLIEDCFLLGARTKEELQRATSRAGAATFGCAVVGVLVFFKLSGISVRELLQSGMELSVLPEPELSWLFWELPLLLLLAAATFAVSYFRLKRAYVQPHHAPAKQSAEPAPEEEIGNNSGILNGYLYKEVRQNRLFIILTAALPFLIYLFFYGLVFLLPAAATGNWDFYREAAITQPIPCGAMMAFLSFFVFSGMLTNIFTGDDKRFWAYFVTASPKGIREYMYCKYILLFAMNGLYMIASMVADSLYVTIVHLVSGAGMDALLAVRLNLSDCFFYLILFLSAFDIPFVVRYGSKKGSMIKTAAMLGVCILGVVIMQLLPYEIGMKVVNGFLDLFKGNGSQTLTLILAFCPFLSLAAYLLSYRISSRVFLKGATRNDG